MSQPCIPISEPDIEIEGDEGDAVERFHALGLTDGLPIVVPTRERVEAMCAGATRYPMDSLGVIAPRGGVATVQKIAENEAVVGSNNLYVGGDHFVVLGPEHARTVAGGGFDWEDVQAYLFEKEWVDVGRVPAQKLEELTAWGSYADQLEASGRAASRWRGRPRRCGCWWPADRASTPAGSRPSRWVSVRLQWSTPEATCAGSDVGWGRRASAMRRRIVDVYCHCGVHKSRPVDDVLEALDGAGVERAVLVQHLGEFDNQSIGRAVAAHPDRFTGVCLIDHGALRAHRESGHFEGVRIQLQHLAAAGDLFHAAVEMELHIVLCTIGGLQPHLAELRTFLEGHPSARVTLTHW